MDLDGRLDEPIWGRVEPAADFIQIDPANGAPATEPTEVYIVYDENNLYMGVICYDSEPDQLMGNTMLRDAFLSADDRFMWIFDTYLDERSGYFFEINPSGAMGDSLLGSSDGRSWDGIWTARVVQSEIGWVAEIEMPFRTLNFDPNNQAWGINFQRTVRRKNEESIWTGSARNQQLRTMSNAGLVTGLSEISQGIGLDVNPYLIGSALAAPDRGEPGNSFTGDAGVDFVYNVTASLRAQLTLNTDFAETEVDDRQVNLTRFPLRFPEKRRFFLEGSNFFGLAGYNDAFFSRRIGLNEGVPQRIDYGAKLTGQIGAHDIGVMQVRTGEENGLFGEDFTLFRGRRRFLTESHVGMLYTRRAVREDSPVNPALETPDLHTLGFDFRMATSRFQDDKNLVLESHFVHTTNPEGTGKSARYGLLIDYPNDLISARLMFNEDQENLDPAVGFIRRRGKDWAARFQFRPRPDNHSWIRQFTFGANLRMTTDSGNLLQSREVEFTLFEVNTHANDSISFEIIPTYEFLFSDFRMGGGSIVLPAGEVHRFNRYEVRWRTGNSRPVALRSEWSWGDYFSGTRRDFTSGVAIRPRNGLVIDLDGEWNRIELPEGSFSTSVLRGNVLSQFNPWISVSSNLQYDTVSRLIGWQARFRWIMKPGNDLYLVYTHNWRNDSAGIQTVDRKAASKFVYTHRL